MSAPCYPMRYSMRRPSAASARLPLALAAFLFLFAASAQPVAAQTSGWVGTWATSPVSAKNATGLVGDGSTGGTTLREIVHVSAGGSTVRVVFTNEFGLDPLTVGAAQIALRTDGNSIAADSAATLLFAGHPSITIPPGALAVSDPVSFKLPAFADAAVSFFVPAQPVTQLTVHSFADQTSYSAPGNVVTASTLGQAKEISNWEFLKGIDVQANGASGASIVAFGDSITDGALSTKNANARWPDVLARRLAGDKKAAALGMLNEGIGGNRVLHDGTGPSALARFDRDVLAQAGVRYLILLEGINDIGHAFDPAKPFDVVSADDLIGGFTQLAERAHTHGIKVYGATLTPFVGAKYQSAAGESARQTLNQWLRTTKVLDGVIDFDKAAQDPADATRFLPAYDSGDHLHPKDAGYQAMGDSINLKLFEK